MCVIWFQPVYWHVGIYAFCVKIILISEKCLLLVLSKNVSYSCLVGVNIGQQFLIMQQCYVGGLLVLCLLLYKWEISWALNLKNSILEYSADSLMNKAQNISVQIRQLIPGHISRHGHCYISCAKILSKEYRYSEGLLTLFVLTCPHVRTSAEQLCRMTAYNVDIDLKNVHMFGHLHLFGPLQEPKLTQSRHAHSVCVAMEATVGIIT